MAEAQHFYMAAKNYTNHTLLPGTPSMSHGGVYNTHDIDSKTTTVTAFYTRGDRDASAGTEGKIRFATSNGETWIEFSWDIPWGLGSDWCKVTCSEDISVSPGRWDGDGILRQTATVTINEKLG